MNPIPVETVESRQARIAHLPEEALEELIDQASEEQPFMLAYLMSAGETEFNESEQELLLYVGVVAWQIMREENVPIRSISEEDLEAAEETNRQLVEYLEGESEYELLDTVETVIANYNQGPLLRLVIESVMDEEEGAYDDLEPVRDEMKGMLILYLKILIDCLDRP
jgi:hypothetical protein